MKLKYLVFILYIVFCFQFIFAQKGATKKIDTDKDMVIIPAGYFRMGSDVGLDDENPVRTVWVDSFLIDKYEVTNEKYKIFCDSTKRVYPKNPIWDQEYFLKRKTFPVINVSWDDATEFAKWSNKRLPTEAEWEKAANGKTKYFCGDTITHDSANFSGKGGKDIWRNCSPVGSFSPNDFGLFDMAGNVWEWCSDFYVKEYYWADKNTNPPGPFSGTLKVIRGGSWDSTPEYLRVSVRGKELPINKHTNLGFRCAKSISK